MKKQPLVTVSNSRNQMDSTVKKDLYENASNVGTLAIAIFAGTMLLKASMLGNNIIQGNNNSSSFIQCIEIGQRHSNFENDNMSVDLMKIENLNKIKKMSYFADDWNGTGGEAFSSDTITFLKSVINELKKQPDIAPTGRGSLLMQYKLSDKSILALEVNEKRVEKVYVPQGNYSKAETETYSEDLKRKIKENVEQFYGYV